MLVLLGLSHPHHAGGGLGGGGVGGWGEEVHLISGLDQTGELWSSWEQEFCSGSLQTKARRRTKGRKYCWPLVGVEKVGICLFLFSFILISHVWIQTIFVEGLFSPHHFFCFRLLIQEIFKSFVYHMVRTSAFIVLLDSLYFKLVLTFSSPVSCIQVGHRTLLAENAAHLHCRSSC